MKAVIYLFAPRASDMQDRKSVREFLASSGTGRMFWELPAEDGEQTSKTKSIPFSDVPTLVQLVKLGSTNDSDFAKYLEVSCKDFTAKAIKERRCLRIKLESVNPRYSPRRFAHMNGREIPRDNFSDKTIGSIELMDADYTYKFKKLYFGDYLELGVAISKVYAAEVYARIPLHGRNHKTAADDVVIA